MSPYWYAVVPKTANISSCSTFAELAALGIELGRRPRASFLFSDENPGHGRRTLRDAATIHIRAGRARLLHIAGDILLRDLPAVGTLTRAVALRLDHWEPLAAPCTHSGHDDCRIIGVALPDDADAKHGPLTVPDDPQDLEDRPV